MSTILSFFSHPALRYPDVKGWAQYPAIQVICAVVVGVVLGALTIVMSPITAMGAVIGAVGAVILLKRTELGLAIVVITASTIMEWNRLPAIPFFRGLKLVDLMFAGILVLIVLRWLLERDFQLVYTPLNIPLMLFIMTAVLSGAIGILNHKLAWQTFVIEFMMWTYYLSFFIVINFVRQRHHLNQLLSILFGIALVTGLAMLAQYIVGNSVVIIPGRVEELITQDTTYANVARVLPPGQSIVMIGFLIITSLFVLDNFRLRSFLWLIAWIILGGAVVVTFNRNFWFVIFLSLLMMGVLTIKTFRAAFVRLMIIVGIGAALLAGTVIFMPSSPAAELVMASVERFASVSSADKISEDESFRWRDTEYEYSIPTLLSNPIFGIGPGAAYRPVDPRLDTPEAGTNGTVYTHNGHMWVLVKSGFVGHISLLCALILCVFRGIRYWRYVNDPKLQSIVLGVVFMITGTFIVATVNPIYMQRYWIPILGIMMGLNEVIYRDSKVFSRHEIASDTHPVLE